MVGRRAIDLINQVNIFVQATGGGLSFLALAKEAVVVARVQVANILVLLTVVLVSSAVVRLIITEGLVLAQVLLKL